MGYCIKTGISNMLHNKLFSLASIVTVSACIFLFCIFYAIVMNVKHVSDMAQQTVGISVFFKEEATGKQIADIGNQITADERVKEVTFISADDAWKAFKKEYFGTNESLASGFEDDNPLANSASYEIYLYNVDDQKAIVNWVSGLEGVRMVNYSSAAVEGLSSLNRLISLISIAIISVLLGVSIFLISNTIVVAAEFRRPDNEIMRYIGATDFMIRAPFVIEGTILGFLGSLPPLALIIVVYTKISDYILNHYVAVSGLFTPLDLHTLLPQMIVVAICLGVVVGFFVSFVTIKKHLQV